MSNVKVSLQLPPTRRPKCISIQRSKWVMMHVYTRHKYACVCMWYQSDCIRILVCVHLKRCKAESAQCVKFTGVHTAN